MITNIKTANKVIYILAGALVIAIVIFLKIADIFGGGHNFNDPVPDSDAANYISKYRNSWTLTQKTYGVWYEIEALRNYTKPGGIFDDLTKNLKGATDCRWVVGFYPERRPDANKDNRLDFLVVPTLVSNKDGSIIDYGDQKGSTGYSRIGTPTSVPCSDCTGYDAGHLWP